MTPMEALEKKPNRFRKVLQGFVGFFTGIPGALYALGILIWQFLKWSRLESAYWFRLFLYTSRNFLRLEALLTVVGAVLFFGYVITNDLAQSGEALIYYSYIYFSVVMVLLAMNVLPREREIGTLEILWSQPLRRSSMVVVQLLTLSVWMLVLNLIWLGFIQYFTAYPEGKWILLLLVWTTTVSVGALTLLISTFCRHSIATGLVMMLLLGLHFYWLTSLGPVQFFYIPLDLVGLIDPAQAAPRGFGGRGGSSNSGWFDLMFNRITLIVTVGFILDFLFRRLRRTAEWFT